MHQIENRCPHCQMVGLERSSHPVWLGTIISFSRLRYEQNGRQFADDILKLIRLSEDNCILNEISLEIVSLGSMDDKSAKVIVIAWWGIGDMPLPKPMVTEAYDAMINHHAFFWSTTSLLRTVRPTGPSMYLYIIYLTHWCMNKMSNILQTTFSIAFLSNCIFFIEKFHNLIQISP